MTLRASKLAPSLALSREDLRWCCDERELGFETTADVEPRSQIIGQPDALDALRFGLELFAPGQNVYVRGLTGTGRMTLLRRVLEEIQPSCPLASDYCYAANFERSGEPRLLELPRGRGAAFQGAMEDLVRFLTTELGPAVSSEDLIARRQFLDQRFEDEAKEASAPFEKELAANDLAMAQMKVGNRVRPVILPVIDGQPAPPERLQQLHASGELSEEDLAALEAKLSEWGKKFESVARRLREVGQRHSDAVRDLVRSEMTALLEAETAPLREDFATESVARYLDDLIQDVVQGDVEELQSSPAAARRYRVNLVLGHQPDEGCPVVVEHTPTLANLLGSIDRRVLPDGAVQTDHLMIQAGSILSADGGYLVLEAREVLREPGAWKVLLRTLRSGMLEIVPSEMGGPWSIRTLKPEPIPIQIKVILIGDPGLYYVLDAQDPDFPHLFKVLADFDSSIERSPEAIEEYAGVFSRVAREENLPHYGRCAVAALAEHAARIAGRRDRLTTRFGRLIDIAREAAFLTSKSTDRFVQRAHVEEAIRRTKRRGDLPARKFRERIADGTIQIAVQGSVVGQVNGLAVIHAGPLTYGFPARITATIGAGHAGTINIEHESRLSGSIHTKGFHILGGLLRHLLQTQHPLAFSASIAFEQSYGGIDGDSASGAEICCLFSALTNVPLRQDVAMTGAIDQLGNILPIGGATEKIEGFYDACVDLGLTGEQGVIIPRSNVADLMLRADVAAACEEGRFHIYAVETIQQALEVFTGVEAGERDPGGEYPEGTLLHTAVERAFEFWSLASTPAAAWQQDEEEEAEASEAPEASEPREEG